eukprot:3146595-Rhodomonas_salina.2
MQSSGSILQRSATGEEEARGKRPNKLQNQATKKGVSSAASAKSPAAGVLRSQTTSQRIRLEDGKSNRAAPALVLKHCPQKTSPASLGSNGQAKRRTETKTNRQCDSGDRLKAGADLSSAAIGGIIPQHSMK